MKVTPLRVLFFILFIVILFIGGFVYMLIYEKKTDLSNDVRFAKYLNIPTEVEVVSTIRWNKNNLRFKHYSLTPNEASTYNSEDLKSVKIYQPGDTIYFYAAKSYKNLHVGETFYLLGKDTLSDGKPIEFEYYFN